MYPPATQKHKASAFLVVVLILAIVSSMLSLSVAKINAVSMNSADANKLSSQAHSLALDEAALVRATDYTSLKESARASVAGTALEREVTLSEESDYTSTIKSRTATINVYKGSEPLPRAALSVTRYSVEQEFSGVPVGTVIAWAGSRAPNTNGVWLECNGQSCAAYPALVAVLGKSTVPDYQGRFLETSTLAGSVKEAGLPNIVGEVHAFSNYHFISSDSSHDRNPTNALFSFYLGNDFSYGENGESGAVGDQAEWGYVGCPNIGFNAAYSSPIYGNSSTVQPASVTVRRFIKAA